MVSNITPKKYTNYKIKTVKTTPEIKRKRNNSP